MDEKTKTEFILLFNQGFEEIVLPEIESLRKEVGLLKTRLESVDRKLDVFTEKVNDNERRINKLESEQSTL